MPPAGKFLLIQMPIWDNATPSYSLAYVAGIIQQAGWECRVADLNNELFHLAAPEDKAMWQDLEFYRSPEEQVAAFFEKYRAQVQELLSGLLNQCNYDLAGFSVNQQSRYLSVFAAQVLSKLAPGLPIIFGGSECFPGEFNRGFLSRQDFQPDLVLQGEAEIALPQFLREYIRTRSCQTSLPGFLYRMAGEVKDTGEPVLPDLQDDVIADYTQFDFTRYQEPAQVSSFFTRGCINQCAFCNERSHFKHFRSRRPESVVAEITAALRHLPRTSAVPTIRFNDSIFNGNPAAVDRLCDLLLKKKLSINWGVQMSFSRKMAPPLWRKMHQAGCRHAFWGFENASQRILDAMQKNFSLDEARATLAMAAAAGIQSHLPLIVGFPGETPEDLLADIRFIREYRHEPMVQFIYVSPIQVKPDSRLFRQANEYGIQGMDEINWYTGDEKNTRGLRIFRTFLLLNAIYNPDWSWEKIVHPEYLPHVDFNQYAVAHELAWDVYWFGQMAGRESAAREFLLSGQETGVSAGAVPAGWHPPAIPRDVDLTAWYARDKNAAEDKERIVKRIFAFLQDEGRAGLPSSAVPQSKKNHLAPGKPKVLFVHCNINTGNGPHFVPGVASISAVLKQAGYGTGLIFLQEEMAPNEFLRQVADAGPALVGFSTLTNQWRFIRKYAAALGQACPDLPVILGGVHATVAAEEVMACPEVKLICVGEGEFPMLELMERIANNQPYDDIRNLWLKKPGGRIIRNPLRPLMQDLDSLPFMDRELFDFPALLKQNAIDANLLMIGRGCPFPCTYCVNHTLQEMFRGLGRYVRMRSPERAVAEILDMKNRYGIDWVNIYDDTLTHDSAWLQKFCALYQEKIHMPFWCNIRLDTVSPESLRQLRQAGCTLLVAGIESGSERVRYQVLRRKMSNQKIIDTFRLIDELGFKTKAYFMIGFPGETTEEMDETLAMNRAIKPNHSQLSVFYPFPHTALHEQARLQGYLTEQENTSFFEGTALKLPEDVRQKIAENVKQFRDDAFLIKVEKEGRQSGYDFLLNLKQAEVFKTEENYVSPTFASINFHQRAVIFAHPESRISYTVDWPPATRLKFGIGISPEVWSPEKGTGVHFEIVITAPGYENRIFSQYLDPKNNPADQRWFDLLLDLPRLAPGPKKISFITTTKGQSNAFCWSMWDHPQLV